ncbi:MAG: acetamidase/formamidase family protein [Pirellulaceae bacterium]|jgi:acetamidase/formamidase|nr:acetamidase/formamidase family protein [Pirellulaceae bacterium]
MEHRFTPTHYYTTLGPHEPVLRVSDGDTIITTTVDARGVDHRREQVTPRGNPQTGPFYVEGAEPGDTLVVELDEIRPNRRYGFAGSSVAPNVVDPTYVRELPQAASGEERVDAEWDVDVDAGTATLVAPESRLEQLVLPIEPMIGCFGVAAKGGQAISTATSAEHGGNMDYRGFARGTTVYFPVFEPGALFFLGDGHAAQGDGEIVGSGIEISLEVQVTLRVLKDKEIGWPRAENDDWIMAVGNARPLDQATQHATTEMLRWLQQDYGLDSLGANLLLSQCVRYDLGNIFDPAYTMVCKLNKRWLP